MSLTENAGYGAQNRYAMSRNTSRRWDERKGEGEYSPSVQAISTCRQFGLWTWSLEIYVREVPHQDVCGLYRWLCACHHALDYSNGCELR